MADTGIGAKRAALCPSCGAEVAPAAKYCSNCGASLVHSPSHPSGPSQSGPAAEGERRPVTILFTDIVGSTAISERLDPEEWRKVVSGAHRRVSDAIIRYEGTIAQLLGDGVLAFFGAPVAHEDHPVRAVHAALDIQTAMAAYARDLAGYVDDFAVRIGIHTGGLAFALITGGSSLYLPATTRSRWQRRRCSPCSSPPCIGSKPSADADYSERSWRWAASP